MVAHLRLIPDYGDDSGHQVPTPAVMPMLTLVEPDQFAVTRKLRRGVTVLPVRLILDVKDELLALTTRLAQRKDGSRQEPEHSIGAVLLGYRVAARLIGRTSTCLPYEDTKTIGAELGRSPSRMSEAAQWLKKWNIARPRGRGAKPWSLYLPQPSEVFPGGPLTRDSWVVMPMDSTRQKARQRNDEPDLSDEAVWLLSWLHVLAALDDRDRPTGRPRRKLTPSRRTVYPPLSQLPWPEDKQAKIIDELSDEHRKYIEPCGAGIRLTWVGF